MHDTLAIAASAINVLSPFLKIVAEKGAEKLGESAGGALFATLKEKLKSPSAQKSLAELEKSPDNADIQSALRQEIREAVEQDPELAARLQGQIATINGDNNKIAQVAGSNNIINM